MKVKLQGRYLYFIEFDVAEIKWVQSKLTWHDERSGTKSTLLYQTEEGIPYTFSGLLEPLRLAKDYDLELVQDVQEDSPEFLLEKPHIPKDYLLFSNPEHSLYDYQVSSIQKAVMGKWGILQLSTGAGKTEILLGILKYLISGGLVSKALVVVPSAGLAENMTARAVERGLPSEWFGIWGDSKRVTNRIVTVAIVDSVSAAWRKDEKSTAAFLESLDYLGLEEAHHIRAKSWADIIHHAKNIKYLHGFTATPFQQDSVLQEYGDALVAGICCRLLNVVTDWYLIQIGAIAQPYVSMKRTSGTGKFFAGRYDKLYERLIVKNPERNGLIVNDAIMAVKYGFAVFIMVERHEHAELLMKLLKAYKVVCKFGGKESLQFDEHGIINNVDLDVSTLRRGFMEGTWDILIGSPAMGTGIDIARIGFMIIAGCGKSRIAILQRRGRAVRKKQQGPNQVYIRDYNDMSHAYFKAQSKKRLEYYIDTSSIIVEDEHLFWQMLYEHGLLLKESTENVK